MKYTAVHKGIPIPNVLLSVEHFCVSMLTPIAGMQLATQVELVDMNSLHLTMFIKT